MKLTIRRPDDMHLHLRDGATLRAVVGSSSQHFARAIIMPNLVPPVVTTEDAQAYRQRIMAAVPKGHSFEPLMTLYLTEDSDPADLDPDAITSVKLYPAGATTNSASGVTNLDKVMPFLERMAEVGLPLCVHGEVTDEAVDIFDREAVFIERVLDPLRQRLPELRIISEHITTKDGADYVASAEKNLAATITPHHLMVNRNAMLVGGIKPHYYCLPIIKREEHRQALVRAAISGDPRFFLGTDSAPHTTATKECACGCAGVFNAPNTLSCLATLFEEQGALDKLEGFTSEFGARYYGLPLNEGSITLERRDKRLELPQSFDVEADTVTIFDPLKPLYWHVTA